MRIDKGDAHATRFVIPTADVADAPLLLFTGKEAAMAWLRSSRKNGWCQGPLPLISIESCVGAAFRGKHLFEWLPGDQIAAPDEPVLTDESITARMVEDCIHEVRGVTVWPTCYLDIDWQFEEIEREARKLRGHNYFGERHSSLREVVWKSLGDFDAVMTSKYPIAPPSALAYFWQSWQIHQHVRQFCKAELVNSVADGTLPFMGQDCNEAGWFALRKLSSYASAISMVGDQASGEPAAEVTDEAIETISNAESQSRKRGPKPDYDAAARVAEIVMRVAPSGDWRSQVDEVGDALDHGICHAANPKVCDASDHEKIPLPRGWRGKGNDWLNPPDRATMVKAIEYRLDLARERKKAIPETLS